MTTKTKTKLSDDDHLAVCWKRSRDFIAARRAIPDDLALDHIMGPLYESEWAMYEEMVEIRASGIAGVLAKLRAAVDFGDFDGDGPLAERLIVSALRDAERLAGAEGE